jgi:hypothetical protein
VGARRPPALAATSNEAAGGARAAGKEGQSGRGARAPKPTLVSQVILIQEGKGLLFRKDDEAWGIRVTSAEMATEEEIREENRKVRRLQIVVDLVMNCLWQEDLSIEEASEMVAATRQFALNLFPDKASTYDLIYKPRFQRLLTEKYRLV